MIEDAINILRNSVINKEWISGIYVFKGTVQLVYYDTTGDLITIDFLNHSKMLDWIEKQEKERNGKKGIRRYLW